MPKEHQIEDLARDIARQLLALENDYFDTYAFIRFDIYDHDDSDNPARDDKITWLFHGTRQLYYKICVFLELKGLPIYLNVFITKFESIINNKNKVIDSRAPLYEESDPSMIILDDFRDFLSAFSEFPFSGPSKPNANKLRLILENTNHILDRCGIIPKSESPIYKEVRWFTEVVFPTTRARNSSRFIKKFGTYKPDILVPEISSAVDYKFIRKGKTAENFLNDLKTDANNYDGDPEYKLFYAVVVFQDKSDLIKESFNVAVAEKKFPENWTILAL